MSKISFSKLGLKLNDSVNIVTIGDTEIEVLNYLPIEDKRDLIEISYQQAMQDGFLNPILLDEYFLLNIVFLYSNINFTDKQREDKDKLFNLLDSNNVLDIVIDEIPQSERDYLKEMMATYSKGASEYEKSLSKIVKDIPKQMTEAANIVEQFDPEKFQEVINFATAANGNRPV